MEFDRKREAEAQLRDAIPEQQEEHALEVVQTVRNAVVEEAGSLEAVVKAMPGALPLEVWANDLMEDARQEALRRTNNELQQAQHPPILFSAPRSDVAVPNEPTPYLFSAVRSDDDAFGGDPPAGPPTGGPPGSGSNGSGAPPPPSPPEGDDDKPDARAGGETRDARTRGTERATKSSTAARTGRSSPGTSSSGTQPANNRKK